MIITYKTVSKLEFPVFKLPKGVLAKEDGLLFLNGILIDDTNMPGITLGERRLQTPQKDLLPLKQSLDSHVGLIKQSPSTYLDRFGLPFIYKKTIFCKLKYHKIKKIEKKTIISLLWVKNINFPFSVPRPPNPGYTWAGVLYHREFPWLLYDYAEEYLKNAKRKV